MATCFVIQPFDGGKKYDKRYEDVFAPAIADAGLDPYRVDRDPSVTIPIEEIQRGIEDSVACLAEVSSDNPNVWYELGYAIACSRVVVLLCSDERDGTFPFDIQHRKIIKYSTESISDFQKVRSDISSQLRARLQRHRRMDDLSSMTSISRVEGLEQYELAGLVILASETENETSAWMFHQDMKKAGFNQLAANLARKMLADRQFIEERKEQEHGGDWYSILRVTPNGLNWLVANQEKLTLRTSGSGPMKNAVDENDDLPF